MQKKVDRRVRKTKSQLRAGLARLMQEERDRGDHSKRTCE